MSLKKWFQEKVCERGQKCSCWFDAIKSWSWKHCCADHDEDYAKQPENKERADQALFLCVFLSGFEVFKAKRIWMLFVFLLPMAVISFIMALIMWCGVRVGGYVSWNKFKKKRG